MSCTATKRYKDCYLYPLRRRRCAFVASLGLVGQRHLARERWSAPTRAAVRSFSLVLRTLFCKVLQLSIYEMPPPDFLTRPSRAPSPVQDFRASRWRAVACSAGGDGGGFTSAIL